MFSPVRYGVFVRWYMTQQLSMYHRTFSSEDVAEKYREKLVKKYGGCYNSYTRKVVRADRFNCWKFK